MWQGELLKFVGRKNKPILLHTCHPRSPDILLACSRGPGTLTFYHYMGRGIERQLKNGMSMCAYTIVSIPLYNAQDPIHGALDFAPLYLLDMKWPVYIVVFMRAYKRYVGVTKVYGIKSPNGVGSV